MGQLFDNELTMYKRISSISMTHPGGGAVRELLGYFDVKGPHGTHRCLVHPPLWESIITFLARNQVRRFTRRFWLLSSVAFFGLWTFCMPTRLSKWRRSPVFQRSDSGHWDARQCRPGSSDWPCSRGIANLPPSHPPEFP